MLFFRKVGTALCRTAGERRRSYRMILAALVLENRPVLQFRVFTHGMERYLRLILRGSYRKTPHTDIIIMY